MNLSLEYLERCAAETGFVVSPLEKVARMGEMAADISRHPFLRNVLALKGGTALNLCFGAPSRLSVDLDFNYIGHPEREKMLEDRPRVEAAVEQLARRHGYVVQRSADAFAGRKIYLTFASTLGKRDRIEIDLNFLFRVPFAGTITRDIWQPGELDRPRVKVVGWDELAAGKMLALLDRGAVRDIWDVGRLPTLQGQAIESPSFRARFVALSATLEEPLPSYTMKHLQERVTDREIAQQLIPLLSTDEAPRAMDIVRKACQVMEPFLSLKPGERDYLAAIERGEIRTELVFPEDEKQARIFAEHPALQWKLLNVRQNLSRRR
jgi:hypothetical protein